MQVIFTVQADQDLEEISDHIAADSASRALSFVREVRNTARRSPRHRFPT